MTENAILSDDQATITFCSTIVMRRTGFQGDQSSSRIPTNNLQGRRIAIAVSSESIWHENRPSIEVHECYFQHFAGNGAHSAAEIFAGFPNLGLRQLIEPLAEPY